MSSPLGDLPDWSTLVKPNIRSSAFVNVGSGTVNQLFQSTSPYRIWAAWISVHIGTNASYVAALNTFGAQIGDGSGAPLLRVSHTIAAANQIITGALSLPIEGYTPIFSAGFFTTNLTVDAFITNTSGRASGGILFSQP